MTDSSLERHEPNKGPPSIEEEQAAMAVAIKAAKRQLRLGMREKLHLVPASSIQSQSEAVFNTLKTLGPYVAARRVGVYLSMPTGEIQTDGIVRHALASGKHVFVPYLHMPAPPEASHALPPAAASLQAHEARARRVMDMVRLHDLADYEALKPDKWGIPSIDPASVESRERILGDATAAGNSSASATPDWVPLDLNVMPGVAFDMEHEGGSIRRLGHGRGFYDLFIARCRAKAAAVAAAAAEAAGATEQRGQAGRDTVLCGLGLTEQFLPGGEGKDAVPVQAQDAALDCLLLGDGRALIGMPPGRA